MLDSVRYMIKCDYIIYSSLCDYIICSNRYLTKKYLLSIQLNVIIFFCNNRDLLNKNIF